MIKKGTRLSLFLTAVLGFLSISVGHAAFQTGENGATDSYDGTITLRKPVCYISGSPNVYYPSIEKALEVAKNTSGSQTVYVIPGANPTIQSDCTIASGDSLILPYADDGTTHTYHQYLEQSPTLAYKSGTLVTKVTIADGFTLTNNGTLTIGAIQNTGSGGNLYSGNATKSYTEIFLEGAAKVVNAGTMNAYGYIASDPANTTASVVMNSGSKTYAPFTVMEHRGGQIFTGMSSSNVTALLASAVLGGATADLTCFPFNRMFVDCFLDVNYSFAKGSYLYGLAALYADSATNTTTMNLIGDSSSFLFNLSSNATFTGRFVTAEEKHKVETFGSFALQSMSLDLAVSSGGINGKIKLSSSDVLLPVSHYYDFTLSPFEDGTAAKVNTTAQGLKLLPGSKITVSKGTILQSSSVAVYRNDDLYPNGKYIADTSVGTSFYPSKNDAQFVVNGRFQANNCGGLLLGEEYGGEMQISTSTTVNSPEIVSTEAASVTIPIVNKTIGYREPTYATISTNAEAYIGTGSKPDSVSTPILLKDYQSKGDYWSEFVPDISSVSITPNSGASSAGQKGSFKLKAVLNPKVNASTNVTYTWSCNTSGGVLSSTTGPEVTLTTPAVDKNGTDTVYTVTCVVNFTKQDGTPGQVKDTGTYKAVKATCVSGDTLVTLANGTTKQIKDIDYGDSLLAFDHISGKTVATSAALIFQHEAIEYQKLRLSFSNGAHVDVLDDHEFFDLSLNRYVRIDPTTYADYVGDSFAVITETPGSEKYESAQLLAVDISVSIEEAYSIQSAVQINFITNSMLSRTVPAYEGWFDYFDFGEPMVYDPVKMNEDIEKYGLYEYSEFEPLGVTEEQFVAFNGPYLKVLVGKGVVTYDQILGLISQYVV